MNTVRSPLRPAANAALAIITAGIGLSVPAGTQWNSAAAADNTALAEHPFAEHRLVLQLSDDDAKKQGLVLSVAYNLLKFYGPDRIGS